VQEPKQTNPRLPFSRRALAAYWLVKAAVELDRRGVRGVFSDSCDLPGSDAAKWTERIHRRWQKSMSIEDLLSMAQRELEILL
jgi:hypothetical protein